MSTLYYIQHTGFCGNCLLWWRDGGHGYTSDLDDAWKVGEEQAKSICRSRPSEDIAWPVDFVDDHSARHLSATEALMAEMRALMRAWFKIADSNQKTTAARISANASSRPSETAEKSANVQKPQENGL
jgi:hypothetical protein